MRVDPANGRSRIICMWPCEGLNLNSVMTLRTFDALNSERLVGRESKRNSAKECERNNRGVHCEEDGREREERESE